MGTGNTHKIFKIIGTLIGAVILCGIGAYLGVAFFYSNKFIPGTEINSIDCSDLTVGECEDRIGDEVENYTLTVQSRNQGDEVITADEIGYTYVSEGDEQKILKSQNPLLWITGYMVNSNYQAGIMTTFDENMANQRISQLLCMMPENQVQPENATIQYTEGPLFEIVEGDEGAAVNDSAARTEIIEALEEGKSTVNLDEADAYLEPDVRADDPDLQQRLDMINTYAQTDIILDIGDDRVELDGSTIKDWFSVDDSGDIYLDEDVLEEKLAAWLSSLAKQYDTVGITRTFTATSGRTVEVVGGTYGWSIDESSEREELYAEILNGDQLEREITFNNYGNYWDGITDIGSTYIEVDLSEQHMYYYQNGDDIFESDFVSGNMSYSDRATPSGTYKLTFKTTDYTLRGDQDSSGNYSYEEHVDYWMPFNNGVGFHDAPWRGSFGGSIYLTNGSHGCINMPFSKAQELYGIIEYDVPIIVFY